MTLAVSKIINILNGESDTDHRLLSSGPGADLLNSEEIRSAYLGG